jgi:tetratricopeptide (TPR) repeat protein
MRTLHAQTAAQISVLAKRLIKLERTGRYEDALAHFGDGWEQENYRPSTEGLELQASAEVMLRFGALIGFQGFRRDVTGAQERSKDLLTAAREMFVELECSEKIAECENYIALAYWRKGEHVEAATWVESALAHPLPENSDPRLYSILTRSLILLSEKRDHENIDLCLDVEDRFRRFADPFLNGSLCANLGVSYRNLRKGSDAMKYFTLARAFHERSGHKTYLAIVENNLALLHNAEGRFAAAHESADSAIRLYRLVKDKVREASSLDSKAQILLTEGRLHDAIDAAERSIKALRKNEGSAYLAESIFTKSRILIAMQDVPAAILEINEAINITRLHNSERAARELAAEFAAELKIASSPQSSAARVEPGEVDLLLPPSIANFSNYKGIWIHTSHLENAGIGKDSLVVVVPIDVARGDLVAISDLRSGEVICGTYDTEFGITCIERGNDEPLLFDSNDIEVLGKIVGVSDGVAGKDGKLRVEPVRTS